MACPMSATQINVAVCQNVPWGYGQALAGPASASATKEEVKANVKGCEGDIQLLAEVRELLRFLTRIT